MNNSKLKMFLILQSAVFLYSLSGIASKIASNYEFLSLGFILSYGAEIFILGVYAIVWQQIIKKVDLSVSYANKAMGIFWSMLWSFFLFKENISVQNILGVILVFLGTLAVNRNV